MSAPEFPQFEIVVNCPEQVLRAKLMRWFAAHDSVSTGWVDAPDPELELRVPKPERRLWSPRLQLSFDALAQGKGTRLQGSFRAAPGVWTGLVFLHCLLGAVATAGLSLGLAQWTLGDPPTAMIATLTGVLLSVGLYFGTRAGAQLGTRQRQILRNQLDRALRW